MGSAAINPASDMRTVYDLISEAPLLSALPQAERVALAAEARPHTYAAGATIFQRSEAGGDVFIVAQGRVRLSVHSDQGRMLTFSNAGPGEIFGEMAAFDGAPRSADATAMVETVVYALPGVRLLRAFCASPESAHEAIVFLCAKLRLTSAQVENIALHRLEIRLARFLLSAVKLTNAPVVEGHARITLPLSQTEIADLVGGSRQKLNEALARLKKKNAVEVDRQGTYVCDVALLKEIARTD